MAYAQPPGLGPPQADFERDRPLGPYGGFGTGAAGAYIYIHVYVYLIFSIFFFYLLMLMGALLGSIPIANQQPHPPSLCWNTTKSQSTWHLFTGAKVKSFLLNCGVADSNLPVSTQSNTECHFQSIQNELMARVRPTRIPSKRQHMTCLSVSIQHKLVRQKEQKNREEENWWLKNSQLTQLQTQAWRREILKSVCVQIRSRDKQIITYSMCLWSWYSLLLGGKDPICRFVHHCIEEVHWWPTGSTHFLHRQ